MDARHDDDRPRVNSPLVNVCFSTTNHLASRIIRWVTRSRVSHAMLTFRDDSLGRVLVFESTGRGFNVIPWTKWRQKNTLVARFAVRASNEEQLQALRRLLTFLGAEYDYIGLLGFFWRRWRRKSRNKFASASKLFCSEAAAMYLKYLGMEEIDSPDTFQPEDLFELMTFHTQPRGALRATASARVMRLL